MIISFVTIKSSLRVNELAVTSPENDPVAADSAPVYVPPTPFKVPDRIKSAPSHRKLAAPVSPNKKSPSPFIAKPDPEKSPSALTDISYDLINESPACACAASPITKPGKNHHR